MNGVELRNLIRDGLVRYVKIGGEYVEAAVNHVHDGQLGLIVTDDAGRIFAVTVEMVHDPADYPREEK